MKKTIKNTCNPTPKLCACGCEEPVSRLKNTYLVGHSGRKSLDSYIIDPNGCWLWQGAISNNGYGTVGHSYVHRVSFLRFKGKITEGYQVHHKCRVRRCCNPDHLELATRAQNSQARGSTKLTKEQVRQIRQMTRRELKVAAQLLGVSKQHISSVWRGKFWPTESKEELPEAA